MVITLSTKTMQTEVGVTAHALKTLMDGDLLRKQDKVLRGGITKACIM